jgi:hypothetical protein
MHNADLSFLTPGFDEVEIVFEKLNEHTWIHVQFKLMRKGYSKVHSKDHKLLFSTSNKADLLQQ